MGPEELADSQSEDDVDPDCLRQLSRSERRRQRRQKALPTWGETPEQTRSRRTQQIKQLCLDAGFSRVGIARAMALPQELQALKHWLSSGKHGDMAWMAQDPARRCDPGLVVPFARSVICLALDYDSAQPHTHDIDLQGEDRVWISRYAWGTDYHVVAERRLKAVTEAVRSTMKAELGDDFRHPQAPLRPFRAIDDFRWSVDHGPVLERAWAQRAGLGWQGKNSLLIHPSHGSFFFLATIMTTLDLDADPPMVDHCGTCQACLQACPTGALVAPGVVDARLCISHATIEINGAQTADQAALLGEHLFGCDVCQDVCPWNRFSLPSGDVAFAPRPELVAPLRQDVVAWPDEGPGDGWQQSPLKRRGIDGLRATAEAIGDQRARASAAQGKQDQDQGH